MIMQVLRIQVHATEYYNATSGIFIPCMSGTECKVLGGPKIQSFCINFLEIFWVVFSTRVQLCIQNHLLQLVYPNNDWHITN